MGNKMFIPLHSITILSLLFFLNFAYSQTVRDYSLTKSTKNSEDGLQVYVTKQVETFDESQNEDATDAKFFETTYITEESYDEAKDQTIIVIILGKDESYDGETWHNESLTTGRWEIPGKQDVHKLFKEKSEK